MRVQRGQADDLLLRSARSARLEASFETLATLAPQDEARTTLAPQDEDRSGGAHSGLRAISHPCDLIGTAHASAASRRRGVRGVSLSSTPSGARASLTALKIAAGGAMAPP